MHQFEFFSRYQFYFRIPRNVVTDPNYGRKSYYFESRKKIESGEDVVSRLHFFVRYYTCVFSFKYCYGE